MAVRRIKREFQDLEKSPPLNCVANCDEDDIYHWTIDMGGPSDTPYENGMFSLEVRFPLDYPFAPPKIVFNTRIYHPNINQSGNICLDILKDNWSPVLTISKILLSLSSLLADPNPSDPLVPEIANLYRDDINKYNKKAKEYTNKYANPDKTIIEEAASAPAPPRSIPAPPPLPPRSPRAVSAPPLPMPPMPPPMPPPQMPSIEEVPLTSILTSMVRDPMTGRELLPESTPTTTTQTPETSETLEIHESEIVVHDLVYSSEHSTEEEILFEDLDSDLLP